MNVKFLLSTSFIALSLQGTAQDLGRTYAITGDGTGDFQWMNIRQVDITSGKVTSVPYLRGQASVKMIDADSKQPVDGSFTYAGTAYKGPQYPTATMVAAAAYDKRHEKLFFTPMRIGELRWIDFSAKGAPQFYTYKSTLLNTNNLADEAKHITRMDIGADGNGYAVTNDANHLIRFTTGKKPVITDLGSLVDAEGNKTVSIHNKCTSWGGDMIADAFGKLYIITANHYVFGVDVETRTATHLGTITGLPANFTTNGAAVDNDGYVVVSSAVSFEGYYKFKMADLAAVKIEGSEKTFNASDLANGNLLFQKEADAKKNFGAATLAPVALNPDARVFPNPVTANEFKVLFDNQKAGQYTIELTDISGRAILNRTVNVSAKLQSERIQLKSSIAKGMYMVKVTDAALRVVFTERIVVQ